MKKNDRQIILQGGLLLCAVIFPLLFLMAGNVKGASSPADYPSRPVEFVMPTGAGSSSDMFGRLVSDIFLKEKILNQPLAIVSKPGNGGAVSYGYTLEKKGNPHVILLVSSTFIPTPLLLKLPYNYKSFTPIANLAVDGTVLVVRSDSPFKTADDLIAEAKKRPKDLVQGGGSITGYARLMGQNMQKATGAQWNFVPFKSGSEVVINLLGGHVDFVFADPTEIQEHVTAGKMRVLLAGSWERFPQFKDVPTIREVGMGEPVMSYRGVVGPPNMPDYAVKKLEAAFKKLTADSERFKKFIGETTTQPYWLSSQEYGKFLDRENDLWKGLLGGLGLLK